MGVFGVDLNLGRISRGILALKHFVSDVYYYFAWNTNQELQLTAPYMEERAVPLTFKWLCDCLVE